MTTPKRLGLTITLGLISATTPILSNANTSETPLEVITVTGIVPTNTATTPGAVVVLDKLALERTRPFSIKEALDNVAGVNVVGEDVFSTHLNIGMRGLNPRRSARTLLLEDGLPLFLAPYGDPSAHYSPPLDRVERIEIVKGSSQVLYGPQTIGGVINFVTNPVPRNGLAGSITAEAGNNSFSNVSVNVGIGNERGGIAIGFLDKSGDGIRANHELGIEEYTLKGTYQLSENQSITARYSNFEENSNVSETGLSLAEYQDNPFQAPTGNIDRFTQTRKTFQLVHNLTLAENVNMSTQMYHVDNERASFRQVNGPGENIELCPASSGLDDTAGLEEALPVTEANSAICGGRWRPREFKYWGFEPRITLEHEWLGVENQLIAGMRYHTEDITRNQFRGYDARFQSLSFTRGYANVDEAEGRAGWHNELIETEVDARSFYLRNNFTVGNWVITPGFRVENVRITTDYLRTEGAAPTNPEKRGTYNFTEFLPGIGINYNGLEKTELFAGVHKGFAPARPSREVDAEEPDASFLATDPEESWNFELGIRSQPLQGTNLTATLFHTVFNEIVIQTEAGRFINAGESIQSGLEVAGRVDFGVINNTAHNIYLEGNYTSLFTAEFTNSQVVFDEEGAEVLETASFQSGNRLPYAPKHMLNLAAGYESPSRQIDARLAVNYVSEQFVDAANTRELSANGMEGQMPSYSLVSLSVNYRPTEQWTAFVSVQNLADREYLASRVDGMVAGRERQITGGLRYTF